MRLRSVHQTGGSYEQEIDCRRRKHIPGANWSRSLSSRYVIISAPVAGRVGARQRTKMAEPRTSASADRNAKTAIAAAKDADAAVRTGSNGAAIRV